jgi:NAD(P)-dependent dehydrogenase (short-subunit alcohol dehydrogenase family)
MTLGPATTADEVLADADLTGRTAVVTGASSGLGAETARALAAAGAHVVLAARDLDGNARVAAEILSRHPASSVRAAPMDLSSLRSVREFVSEFSTIEAQLDILVNNAGVMGTPLSRTVEGFEMQLGVNHLAHFLLTNLVRPMLEVSGRARVVNVSSGGHNLSDIVWDDPNYLHHEYDKWEAYGQSKTANALFALALDRRLAPFGGHAYSVHPGMVGTRLARYLEKGDFKSLMSRGGSRQTTTGAGQSEARERVPMKSVEAGAATTVWAVVASLESSGGSYLEDCSVGSPAAWASDLDAAERLWSLSDALVGETFS